MKILRCPAFRSIFAKFVLPYCFSAGMAGILFLSPAIVMAQAGPQASVASELLFEKISYGSSTMLPLPVTNSGGGSLTIAASINGPSFTIAGASPAGCMQGTPAGQTCTLTVNFAPVRVGSHGDILTLQTNGSSNPVVRLIGTGTGVGPVLETALNFGEIPVGSTKVLR